MNRGHVLQSSPVQQMVGGGAGGNPNWWNMISSMRPPPLQQYQYQHQHQHQLPSPPPNFLPHPSNLFPQYAPSNNYHPPPTHFLYDNQELHQESLSQLLLGGLVGEEVEKSGMSHFHELLHHHQASNNNNNVVGHVKQETSSSSYNNNNIYGHNHANNHQHDIEAPSMLVSNNSPNSSLTSANNNMLDFSGNKNDGRHPPPDRSSESNSSGGSGGAVKKARVQPSSTQSSTSTTFKVRKEKLGDRITALHQLVSPFGKTDTASVLLEAIGYIRFLQNQIEALSLPYLGNGSGNNIRQHHQQSVHGERNCIFPEDPGQTCNEELKKDLRSKGLCLVPVSCTLQVGSDNGADYWAPALGRGFQ